MLSATYYEQVAADPGRLLIETSATDGYLVEDGSGVLVTEESVLSEPQLVTPGVASLALTTFAPSTTATDRQGGHAGGRLAQHEPVRPHGHGGGQPGRDA